MWLLVAITATACGDAGLSGDGAADAPAAAGDVSPGPGADEIGLTTDTTSVSDAPELDAPDEPIEEDAADTATPPPTDADDAAVSDIVDTANAADDTNEGDSEESQSGPEEDIVEAPAPPPPVVRRISPWPGRGMQVYVERTELTETIEIRDASGAVYPATVAELESVSGLTLIALEGTTDPWDYIARTQRAVALIEALPADERIAIWSGTGWMSEFTDRRTHLLARLNSTEAQQGEVVPMDTLADVLRDVEGPFGAIHRDLVVIGDDPENEPTAESILARRERLVRVGVCANMDDGEAFVLSVGGATALLEAPEPMESMAWVPCSGAAAAIDAYPFGDTIAFYMSDEAFADFQWHETNKSKNDWAVNVAIGPGLPQSAIGHFRGNSSLNCQRKSITINLDGGEPRRIVPGGADDEFLLVSMCLDDRYFQQYLANHLLQSKGLFLPRQRYVRLTINGQDRGVYLLLENPTETIRRRHVSIESVLRRRNEAEGAQADMKWPSDPVEAEAARQQYESMVDLVWTTDPADLESTLAEHIDLEMFLQWLAFHTYVRNGDYVDEVYLYASMENGGLFYRPSGWDADDLLSNCHHGGVNALYDPYGIYYCAEGNLEHALLSSPPLYDRFVNHLEALILDVMPYETMVSTVFMVRDDLFAHLEEESVCGAMVEIINANPQAGTCAGAKADIDAQMQAFLSGLSQRSTTLLNKIEAYRDAQ
ncbi:MAG: CotH kinase family protein [Myxococcota bacterium]